MESKYFQLLSFLVIFLLNPFPLILSTTTNYEYSPHHHDQYYDTKNPPPPPLAFLKNLIGTRKGNSAKGISQLKKYLSKLGYIDDDNTKPPSRGNDHDFFDDALELAIINYQSYFKLTVNGILDAGTVQQMMRPRCGVPDSGSFTSTSSTVLHLIKNISNKINIPIITTSHYTFFPGSPKWPPTKRNLTYSFPHGNGGERRNDLNTSVSDALDMWASVSLFRFRYILDYDEADIKISFEYGDHGDGNPFDGIGGFWGHAYEPIDGRVHYDGDERWVDGVVQGAFDLRTVGLHELGHVLGLGHTTNDASIMYPYIGHTTRKGFDQEDIKGIRNLYFYPS